jgi:hypothetical protein
MPDGLVGAIRLTRQSPMLTLMKRSLAAAFCIGVAARLGDFSAAAHAEDFTADLVTVDPLRPSEARPARIYVSDNKVRLDPAGFHGGFFIIDGDTGTATFVRPKERVFMDAKQSTPLTQIFVPLNPTAPCPRWKEMALSAGALEQEAEWRCAMLGDDVVDGRTLLKYQMGPSEVQQRSVWLDPARDHRRHVPTSGWHDHKTGKYQTRAATSHALRHSAGIPKIRAATPHRSHQAK